MSSILFYYVPTIISFTLVSFGKAYVFNGFLKVVKFSLYTDLIIREKWCYTLTTIIKGIDNKIAIMPFHFFSKQFCVQIILYFIRRFIFLCAEFIILSFVLLLFMKPNTIHIFCIDY